MRKKSFIIILCFNPYFAPLHFFFLFCLSCVPINFCVLIISWTSLIKFFLKGEFIFLSCEVPLCCSTLDQHRDCRFLVPSKAKCLLEYWFYNHDYTMPSYDQFSEPESCIKFHLVFLLLLKNLKALVLSLYDMLCMVCCNMLAVIVFLFLLIFQVCSIYNWPGGTCIMCRKI